MNDSCLFGLTDGGRGWSKQVRLLSESQVILEPWDNSRHMSMQHRCGAAESQNQECRPEDRNPGGLDNPAVKALHN